MLSMKWRMVLFSAPTILLIGYAHFYLFRRLVAPVTQSRAWRRGIIFFATVAFVTGFASRFLVGVLPAEGSRLLATSTNVWSGFLLYLLLCTFALHGYERAKARWRRTPLPSPERRAVLQTVAGSVFAAAGISTYGTYNAFMGPQMTETIVRLRGLPKSLEGFTIAQLTDVHVGPLIQSAFLKELVHKTNALKPDLTVITGDLVDGRVDRLSGFVRELGALQARHGVCFITGNHDYYSGADEWCEVVNGLGFNVLRNRNILVDGLRVIGVDDLSATRFGEPGYDLAKAMTGVRVQDEATVLLAHQPGSFDDTVARNIGLQLSGHTHGGQMFPATLGAYAIWGERSRGLSATGDSQLFVSRGCGFVGPPFRVGSPPEIAKIVLVSG